MIIEESYYECPYNWDMENFLKYVNQDLENLDFDNEDDIFLINLIKHLMICCEAALKLDFHLAEKSLTKLVSLKVEINETLV